MFALPATTGKKKETVSAEDNQIKLLVNFKMEKVTKCVGFIVNKRLIAATPTCGFTYVNALNTVGSPKMIPYSNENEIKIKDNFVSFPGKKISLMTVRPLIISYYMITKIGDKHNPQLYQNSKPKEIGYMRQKIKISCVLDD